MRAWKREPAYDPRSRVAGVHTLDYDALDPARPQDSDDPVEILAGGSAWCWGYVLVLGDALAREGFGVQWVTMVAKGHPRGVGP